MAGIYIHIPFCRKACHYCNFHFSTSLKLKNEFVTALLKEIQLQREFLNGEPVETIYFGGGTPSLLEIAELKLILEALSNTFPIVDDAEVTLEANPDDISTAQLVRNWRELGINRLSLGVQSFFEDDLRWMNRAHSATQAVNAIGHAQAAGINNITIDLIYGTPTLSDEKWIYNLDQAAKFDIPHLSCYALTVEPRTTLEKLIEKKQMAEVNSDDQARQFNLLIDWTDKNGYEHYEISNFAKHGLRSRHNSSYWQGKPYLGLGPSAHSFKGDTRQWNVANNTLYIKSLDNGHLPAEIESLSTTQQLNEYLMTASRTSEGIDLEHISKKFGAGAANEVFRKSNTYQQRRMMSFHDGKLILLKEGKLFADGIAADLFFD